MMKGMHWMYRSGWALLAICVAGCSVFSGIRQAPSRRTVREVPYQARGTFDGPKKRLLVLPFIDLKVGRAPEVAVAARKSVVQILNRTGQFLVIRNSDFPKDLSTFKSNQTYDLEKIAKMSQGLGIAAVIEGTILQVKARRLSDQVGFFRKVQATVDGEVKIRAVATKTSREIMNDVRRASVMSQTTRVGQKQFSDRYLEEDPKLIFEVTQKAFAQTIPHIARSIDKLNWEGRIALVKGDRVYLNAGRLSGLQVGDILKVMEDGEEIFDPETGSLIGRVPGRMKGTLEIFSYFGKDGAIGVVHSGSGFQENDRVELY